MSACMYSRGNNHSSNATARKTSPNSHYTMKYAAEVVSLKWSDSELQRQRNCWKKERTPTTKADMRVATVSLLSLSHSIRDVPYSTRYTVRSCQCHCQCLTDFLFTELNRRTLNLQTTNQKELIKENEIHRQQQQARLCEHHLARRRLWRSNKDFRCKERKEVKLTKRRYNKRKIGKRQNKDGMTISEDTKNATF